MAVKNHDPKEYGNPYKFDPDFQGPLRSRSCTDVLCLLLFLVFIGCWIGIGLFAFIKGDPRVLLVPIDSQGARCGLDSHVIDKPYLFFFDLTKCLQPIPFTGCRTNQVCVSRCPSKSFLFDSASYNSNDMICEGGLKPYSRQDAQRLVAEGKCARWYLNSKPVQKRCVPNLFTPNDISQLKNAGENVTTEILDKAKDALSAYVHFEEIGSNIVSDIVLTWKHIVVGLVLALVVCIIYITLMRWIAGVMVWLSIIGVIAVLGFCVYFCTNRYLHYKANPISSRSYSWRDNLLEKKEVWLTFTIIVSIILVIVLLMLIFLRKRIVLAIALIKEASRAVSSVTTSLFFPIFPWTLQIGIIVYAISVALYLASTGPSQFVVRDLERNCRCTGEAQNYKTNSSCDPTIFKNNCFNINDGGPCTLATCEFVGVDSPNIITYLHVFNVFGFFWGLFFISGLGDMILASTFATWYWTFRKRDVPFFTVTKSVLRILRFHLGTIAFGSLIIAICTMIRVLLEYIDSKLKKYENPFTKAILCCCKCFFWCLENFIKFINRNAYIMCSIHGRNFCMSAKDAFNLLMRNIIRVFVLDKVTDFLLFLSKILVTAGVTCVAYFIFAPEFVNIKDAELNYYYIPVIIIGICTFFITLVFFSVFTMAVDTLFLCFLEDSERNDGSPEKPYFMSKNLMQILGKKNK